MEILFENQEYWICVKPSNLVSEQTEKKDGFADLLAAKNNGYVGVIHRLDKGVGGVMVYAKTKAAAARLCASANERSLQKEYVALLSKVPAEPEGTLEDLLYFDRSKNKVYPVKKERNGVKKAILTYRTLGTVELSNGDSGALVSVTPVTGRTHQIRVQFASRGLPIVGDRKYGDSSKIHPGCICLCCHSLTVDGVTYTLPSYPWEEPESNKT